VLLLLLLLLHPTNASQGLWGCKENPAPRAHSAGQRGPEEHDNMEYAQTIANFVISTTTSIGKKSRSL